MLSKKYRNAQPGFPGALFDAVNSTLTAVPAMAELGLSVKVQVTGRTKLALGWVSVLLLDGL